MVANRLETFTPYSKGTVLDYNFVQLHVNCYNSSGDIDV